MTKKIERKKITEMLSKCLENYIKAWDTRVYWAKEVTFDYRTPNAGRVDYIRFKPINNKTSIEKGCFYCYEIKSCVEDFHSKNGHNFLGDYNYYIMEADTYDRVKKEIPEHVGVMTKCCDGLSVRKKAKKIKRKKSAEEMLLMMFRSCARDRRVE